MGKTATATSRPKALTQLESAGVVYIDALVAQERAEQAVTDAKALLCEIAGDEGTDEIFVGDKKIKIIESVRRNFVLEKLRKLVTPKIFDRVTKSAIDTKAFDEAVKQGVITAKQEQGCVEPTFYTQVRVSLALGKTATK